MLTLLSLPNEVFDLIMNYLNQKRKLAVMLMNKELYQRTIKSLYQRIYFNSPKKALYTNTYVCTPFNCEYTILNHKKKFYKLFRRPHGLLRLVKLVLFETFIESDIFRKRYSKSRLDWIKLGLVQSALTKNISDVDIMKEAWFPFSVPLPDRSKHTITKLTISLGENIRGSDMSFIPYLKALNHLVLTYVSCDNLNILSSKLDKVLNIRWLRLEIVNLFDLDVGSLIDIVNLTNIRSLEFDVWDPKGSTSTKPVELEWLFQKLHNLKHLSIEAYPKDWRKAIADSAKDNSLDTLTVGHVGHGMATSMNEIFNKQEKSIQKIACHSFQDSLIRADRFDRIYKPSPLDREFSGIYERIVTEFLRNNSNRYPRLNYIIMGDFHYEITRSEAGFQFNPVNY